MKYSYYWQYGIKVEGGIEMESNDVTFLSQKLQLCQQCTKNVPIYTLSPPQCDDTSQYANKKNEVG
jgi:hypothetical protein